LSCQFVKTKFGALYTAFQFGAPPHAGIAPGVDRMLMLLTDSDSIKNHIDMLKYLMDFDFLMHLTLLVALKMDCD